MNKDQFEIPKAW